MAGPSASSSTQSSSSAQTALALVVATLIGVGGGGFLGFMLTGEPSATNAHGGDTKVLAEPVESSHGNSHGASGHAAPATSAKEAPTPPKLKFRELTPIVTNLAAPETGWVRLQAAIVYDSEAAPQPDVLVSEVAADIVAFLRTCTLASIEGADGLRRLHEDLSERAVIRSEGRIRELIIQALVVQ